MRKKTRSVKGSIIHYTLLILYVIFIILVALICWSFGNMFESRIWLYLMGIFGGWIITYPLTYKSKSNE
jgi:hypothetical protein